MTRIVTTTYYYKRPSRQRKAVALAVPAIVKARRGKPQAESATDPHPANDARVPAPRKSAIVTTASRARRREEWPVDDDPEATRIRAWLEQAKWGRGRAG